MSFAVALPCAKLSGGREVKKTLSQARILMWGVGGGVGGGHAKMEKNLG